MKISVVIPVYNHGQYLSQAVESVMMQTETPHELIIVDDGSTDNSLEVAHGFHSLDDLPVKVVHQVNKGLASARNTGIMNATGDYIFFLDADDMMLEDCLKKCSETILETDADIVAPSLKEFGISNYQITLDRNLTLKDFRLANRIGYFAAVRRSALLEVGGYSSKMTWGYEDYHLWINLLTVGKRLVTIPEPLILYRTKEQSMIREAQAHHLELMAQIYKDFPNF